MQLFQASLKKGNPVTEISLTLIITIVLIKLSWRRFESPSDKLHYKYR
jgi:hypothetical protein